MELDEKAQREPTLGEKLEAVEAAAGLEQGGKIVVYTSSMQAVAATYNACVAMRKILQRLRVPFEERDIMMCSKFTEELRSRLDQPTSPGGSGPDIALPRLFFNGQHLGVCLALFVIQRPSTSKLSLIHPPPPAPPPFRAWRRLTR